MSESSKRIRRIVPILGLLLSVTHGVLAQNLILKGGSRFDTNRGEIVRNGALVILEGRIARLEEFLVPGMIADPDSMPVVELDDEDTILPGLIDLHAHYNINVAGRGRIDETEHYSVIYLANGVTTTFSAGEYNPDEMRAMRLRIEQGAQLGPRVLNSGPYYGMSMRRGADAREVIDRVETWAAQEARGFKAKRISPEQLQALITQAHKHHLTVTGHLDSGFRNSVNPRDAILMGIDRIEHFLGGDLLPDSRSAYDSLEQLTDADIASPAMDAIIELYLERGVYFDATLSAYGYFADRDEVFNQWTDESRFFTQYVREWAKNNPQEKIEQFGRIYRVKHKTLKRFHDAGGAKLITMGTDHASWGAYLAGFAAHREMHAMTRAGIPPADVLRIATINGARAMRIDDETGSIEIGKSADLFIIKGNPLEDITSTRTVHTVIRNGVVHDTAELLKSVEGTMGPAGDASTGS